MSVEGEGIYESLPEDIVKSVLEQSGFSDDLPPEEVAAPAPVVDEEVPPVETEEDDGNSLPLAPGGPLFVDEEGNESDLTQIVTLPDGRQFPLALVQEWADRGQSPLPQPTLPSPPSLPPSLPPPVLPQLNLPVITPEDLEMAGPVGQAMLMIANRQAQELAQYREQLNSIQQSTITQQRRESAEIANGAATMFQQTHNLPDDLMEKIKETAEVHDIERYLSRDPNPAKAVEYALTRSYWNNAEARQYEFERQSVNHQKALERKRKLAGVGGSGGSGPRGTPQPEDTAEGRKAAAIEEVRAAMFGAE